VHPSTQVPDDATLERDEPLQRCETLTRERDDLRRERDELSRERTRLLETVVGVEGELGRLREQTERMSRMFVHTTRYSESVRESARHDAQLALRKARARVERTLGDLERERKLAESDLHRLQALTTETRKRLVAFTSGALEALEPEADSGLRNGRETPILDLREALQKGLGPAIRSGSDGSEAGGLDR
jgi:chromosome segregation ATPase